MFSSVARGRQLNLVCALVGSWPVTGHSTDWRTIQFHWQVKKVDWERPRRLVPRCRNDFIVLILQMYCFSSSPKHVNAWWCNIKFRLASCPPSRCRILCFCSALFNLFFKLSRTQSPFPIACLSRKLCLFYPAIESSWNQRKTELVISTFGWSSERQFHIFLKIALSWRKPEAKTRQWMSCSPTIDDNPDWILFRSLLPWFLSPLAITALDLSQSVARVVRNKTRSQIRNKTGTWFSGEPLPPHVKSDMIFPYFFGQMAPALEDDLDLVISFLLEIDGGPHVSSDPLVSQADGQKLRSFFWLSSQSIIIIET